MNIHFRPLLQVEVEHAYYEGLCDDIEFVRPAQSALAAGKLLTRVRDGRLHLLFEADDNGDPLRDLHGTTLLFGLRVSNPYFANFTAPPVAARGLLLYGNRAQSRTLDAPLAARFIAPRQRIEPTQQTRPLSLRWQLGAVPLVEQSLVAGDSEAAFSTGDWPSGRYTLIETVGVTALDSHWVKEPALASESLWGVLALTIDRNFYTSPPVFTLALQARSESLQYYIVASNFGASEFAQLTLVDAGSTDQGRTALDFDRLTPDQFTAGDIQQEALGDSDTRIALFQSQSPVARRAGGYRQLQLKRDSEVLVQHLPQAGSDRAQARFIVHLAKP